jgi:hypothetical protein
MEVLKVKVAVVQQTTSEHLEHLKDLEISKYKRFFSLERP